MKNIINNKKVIAILVVILFFTFLCALFPYTGDDWAWGSSIGVDRLQSGFDNYNGRWAGNITVMLLTRSVLLRVIVMTATLVGIIYLTYRLVDKKNFSLFLLATLLILAIPKLLFRQAVVWTAGFTNYAIPTVLILIYFYMIKVDVKENKILKMFLYLFLLVLGFCTALFVEHITIYAVAITIFLIIYKLIKDKILDKKYIYYLIGAIIGAVLMFSNSGYRSVANNEDSYRNMPVNRSSIYNTKNI